MILSNWLWFTKAHCAVYRGTRGWLGGNLLGMHMLLLTTEGRKSGLERTLPLAYVEDADDFVVVASNGGADRPPAWWLNLQAAATARIQVGADVHQVSWRVVDASERVALWRKLQAAIPAYRAYRHRTDREIPIVRLHPLPVEWETRSLASSPAPPETPAG